MPEQKHAAMCGWCGSIVDGAAPGESHTCLYTDRPADLEEAPDVVYHGVSHGAGPSMVLSEEPGREAEKLDARTDIKNHSPSGFAWGYRGSGPAQLALAVLADYYDDETAVRHYQDFKDAVVARADNDGPFVVTGDEIDTWMEGRR